MSLKFFSHHQTDILNAFEGVGYTKDDFSFIKRKGRIITQHNTSKSTFSYLMREETTVDDNSREWVEITYFKVRIETCKEFRVETWNEVMIYFSKWLKDIKLA